MVADPGRSSVTKIPRIQFLGKGSRNKSINNFGLHFMRRHVLGPAKKACGKTKYRIVPPVVLTDPSLYQLVYENLQNTYSRKLTRRLAMIARRAPVHAITEDGTAPQEKSRSATSDLLPLVGDVSRLIAGAQVANSVSVIIRKLTNGSHKMTIYQLFKRVTCIG